MSFQTISYIIDHQQPKFGFIGQTTDRNVITHLDGELSIVTWTHDYQINGSLHPRLFSIMTSLYLHSRSPLLRSFVDGLIYFLFVRAHEVPEILNVQCVSGKHNINIGVNQGQAYLKVTIMEDGASRQIVYPISQRDSEGINRWFDKRGIKTC
jgi:hypothetical protein